ncbi:MAG TPA: sulfatase-like hydrolase/transferase, partial [Pirellulaceae bacterium]|nr:sulfatase-like hydrolase/transferase [Pirellulaceae bacterium]
MESGASDSGRASSPPGLDGDPTRQFRVPGQSPHLLLAIVEDLSREDLGCYGARWLKTPRMNEIAEQGLRHTRLAGSASGQGVERTALWFGELPPTPPEGKLQRLPRTSLPEMLWQAGFAPTLLGDCSWAGGGAAGQGGWHHSYGWDEQDGTKFDTYPRAVRRDGRAEQVTDNAEIEATRFERLLFDEAKRALVEHEETHRPVALVVTLRLRWWRDAKYVNVAFEHENWTAAEKEHASAILAVDRLIGEIGRQVEKSIGARRTIIAVVGLPREKPSPELTRFAGANIEKEAALSGKQRWPYAPLIVRWPGRIQAGSVMTSFCGFQDLLPTFGEMVQARQTPREI